MKKTLNVIAGMIIGLMVLLGTPSLGVSAAEFTVVDAEAVLYTNENTVILADADDNTVVLPVVEAGLPIQVTGVTSNGYFRINLDSSRTGQSGCCKQ